MGPLNPLKYKGKIGLSNGMLDFEMRYWRRERA